MKRIGIVGGVDRQSTVEYYAGLCRLGEQRQSSNKFRDEAFEAGDVHRIARPQYGRGIFPNVTQSATL